MRGRLDLFPDRLLRSEALAIHRTSKFNFSPSSGLHDAPCGDVIRGTSARVDGFVLRIASNGPVRRFEGIYVAHPFFAIESVPSRLAGAIRRKRIPLFLRTMHASLLVILANLASHESCASRTSSAASTSMRKVFETRGRRCFRLPIPSSSIDLVRARVSRPYPSRSDPLSRRKLFPTKNAKKKERLEPSPPPDRNRRGSSTNPGFHPGSRKT